MMDKNIVLVGFMGSGKSRIGRGLAKKLNCTLYVTDEIIEQRAGKSIAAIFKEHGEAYFRDLESAVVKEVSLAHGVVIDCGGGVVTRAENLQNLKSNGIVFFLKADVHTIYQRVKNEKHRPLLQVPDPLGLVKELYQQRLPLYNQADFIINTNGDSIKTPIVEILKKI